MSTVNGYTIVKLINSGGFCDAFEVNKGGVKYFMKAYKDPTVMSKDYKDFIKNQDRMIPILKSLGNITETIVDSFEVTTEGRYYQIKEFIDGATNLRDWMENNFDYDERLDIAIQFCKILKAVHAKKIIHQDLKPEQVMTVKDPSKKAGVRIVLTDFDWSVPNGHIVRPVGTIGYQNPDGKKLSYNSDIFTLGIIICELLTGANPYLLDPKTGNDRAYNCFDGSLWYHWVTTKDYMTPNKINDSLLSEINDIIVKCLDPNQNNRPTLDDILDVLQGESVGDDTTPPPSSNVRKKARITAESGNTLLMVPGKGYGRDYFKTKFPDTTDADGNPIYKYLDKTYSILYLSQKGNQLYVSCAANGKAKNEILLNGKLIPDTDTPINHGDKISIFSTSKGSEIATFMVEIIP